MQTQKKNLSFISELFNMRETHIRARKYRKLPRAPTDFQDRTTTMRSPRGTTSSPQRSVAERFQQRLPTRAFPSRFGFRLSCRFSHSRDPQLWWPHEMRNKIVSHTLKGKLWQQKHNRVQTRLCIFCFTGRARGRAASALRGVALQLIKNLRFG